MLEFRLDNHPLIINQSTSVKLSVKNPFFNFREFPGDAGLGIEIPVNEHNRARLGNPQRFEKLSTGVNEFPGFEIRFSGWLIIQGTLIIQNATSEKYSCWLRSSVGNIGKEYRDKNIADLPSFSLTETFQNKADYIPGEDNYCCPAVWNPQFFDDVGKKMEDSEEGILEHRFNSEPSYGFINAKNPDGTVVSNDATCWLNNPQDVESFSVNVVSPMLFVNYVVKKLFTSWFFRIENNFLETDEFYKNLCFYHYYDITKMLYATGAGWIPIHWFDSETQKATARDFSFINRSYSTFKYKYLLPQISFKELILSLQNFSNTCFHFKKFNRVDILDRESILAGDTFDLSSYLVGAWEMGEKKDTTLKFTFQHDKNDTIISERWTSLDNRREDIREPVDNWIDLETIENPELGEIRYIKNIGVFAEYTWVVNIEREQTTNEEIKTDMLGWDHISLGLQNGFYNYGKDQTEEFPTKFSSFTTHYRRIGTVMATAFQRGTSGSMRFAQEKSSPRLWSNAREQHGNFEWEGEDGIISRRWKNTARFLSSCQPVSFHAEFPVNILDYVIRNIPYKFRAREGEFFIEELDVEFTSTKIGVAKMKGYKI